MNPFVKMKVRALVIISGLAFVMTNEGCAPPKKIEVYDTINLLSGITAIAAQNRNEVEILGSEFSSQDLLELFDKLHPGMAHERTFLDPIGNPFIIRVSALDDGGIKILAETTDELTKKLSRVSVPLACERVVTDSAQLVRYRNSDGTWSEWNKWIE